MIFTILEIGFRGTYWVVEKTVSSLWQWYWPSESLDQQVQRLQSQVFALQQQISEKELDAHNKSDADQQ